MKSPADALNLFLTLAKTQAILNRRFDSGLGGLGLTEFLILLALKEAPKQTLCRLELADKVGLTASGVTRVLLPMEKIGLVTKEKDAADARISLVALASGGKRTLAEALDRARLLTDTLLTNIKPQTVTELTGVLNEISRNTR